MNHKLLISLFAALFLLFNSCNTSNQSTLKGAESLSQKVRNAPQLKGKKEYLASRYVTAGDRVYMVGHQNGQFPDVGWHVKGEMGGIWNHPIKLMDGFSVQIADVKNQKTACLDNAKEFVNYPFANRHVFEIKELDLKVERFQFVPDGKEGLVVEFTLQNQSAENRLLTFDFNGMVDLRPVWLGERTEMVDGSDFAMWTEAENAMVAKDSLNDWFTVFGSDSLPSKHQIGAASCDFERLGKGISAQLQYEVNIEAKGKTLMRFFIAGSAQTEKMAMLNFQEIRQNYEAYLKAKQKRYERLASTSKLTIPDKDIEEAFEWVKYNTDWLVRNVPEFGTGLGAGIDDYPWWFGCDNTYSLQGTLAIGRPILVKLNLNLLQFLSTQNNGESGRVIHEASTNGAVYNLGNLNETPHFTSMVWKAYAWTGSEDILKYYYVFCKNGMNWLLEENDKDKNLLPDGAGMMEIHGLDSEMIDVAVYTQQGFSDLAKMARIVGEMDFAAECQVKADQLKEKINTDFWVEDFDSYADFISTPKEAMHLIDNAIIRADTLNKPWAVEELKATKAKIAAYPPNEKRGFVVHHNWVVNTPMEMGIADQEKAIRALKTGSRFVNPFGVFVTGIDRDESAETESGSFAADKKIFSYTGAVMTLPTGVQAIAEANYGRVDESLAYLKRMVKSFGYALPGSMYEVSPDFGMMVQAWNVYALAAPIVRNYFGIQPESHNKRIVIAPEMPTAWKAAKLENVPVGDNRISIEKTTAKGKTTFKLSQSREDWEIVFQYPIAAKEVEVNGEMMEVERVGEKAVLRLKGRENVLVF
ncbi:MAG: hypothetical protein AB8B69_14430 [Chitinophagales bacterium]